MHLVGLWSQSKMSMIFSAPSGGGKMAFSEVNTFPWILHIPCSLEVQTIIDFSFCIQAAAGKGSGVNLTSSRAFVVITTIWMGMAGISVIEMQAPIPGILSWGRSSSNVEIKGLERFREQMIFNLGLEPEAHTYQTLFIRQHLFLGSSLRIFWSVELSLFLFELPPDWVHDKAKNTLDHHSWRCWVNFISKERHWPGTTLGSLSHSTHIPHEVEA